MDRVPRTSAIIAAVLVVGIAATGLAGWVSYQYYQRVEFERAEHKTDNAASAVRLALDRVALSVTAVRAMYASDWVTSDQFVRFARTLAANESARSLAFYRRIALADRLDYERGLPGDPAATLGVWQYGSDGEPMRAPDRPEYYVVESGYLTSGGEPVIGLDAASLPGRRDSIERAIATFGLVASDVVRFTTTGETGLVFYLPAIDRNGTIVGVASGSVTLDQLARIATLASGVFDIRIAVTGDDEADAASDGSEQETAAADNPFSRSFAFGGKVITVTVPSTNSSSVVSAWLVLLIVGAGLATTIAIVAYMVGLAKTTELREARTRLRGMLDGLGPVAWLLSPDGTIIHANRAAAETLDRQGSNMEGKPLWDLLVGDGDRNDVDQIRRAVRSAAAGSDVRFDLFIEPDDAAEQVLDLWIRPLVDKGDTASALVASAVDVTARHEVERTLRLLMRELDHRMKNTLQVVQSIIRRTARAQDTVPTFEAALLGRVGAMSRAHELLAKERWLGAGMATVVGQEVRSFDAGNEIQVAGPNVRLNPKAALSIAMAIHELGTNASKYGALSTPNGRIAVTWTTDRRDGETWLQLRWVESGGPKVVTPENNGFGTMLIERSIAYELDGQAEIAYHKQGLECTIALPLRAAEPRIQTSPEKREEVAA